MDKADMVLMGCDERSARGDLIANSLVDADVSRILYIDSSGQLLER